MSAFAIAGGLGVAVIVYTTSAKDGVAGARLILIGVGIVAMLGSLTAHVLTQAAEWDPAGGDAPADRQPNGATWAETTPAALAVAVPAPALLSQARNLTMMQMSDDAAAALGACLKCTRALVIAVVAGISNSAMSAPPTSSPPSA